MHRTGSQHPQQDLVRFFILAFLWSWLWLVPPLLEAVGWLRLPGALRLALAVLAVVGPAFAAFCRTRTTQGAPAATELGRRGWSLRFKRTWLVPALLLGPAVWAASTLVLALLELAVPLETAPSLRSIALVLVLALLAAAGQEYGWRGFALDRLQTLWGPIRASLFLGLLWGAWSLPFRLIVGSPWAAFPPVPLALHTMAWSMLFTWMYNRSGGSILVAILFHASTLLSALYLPAWVVPVGRWVSLGLALGSIFLLAFVTGWRKYRRA